MPTYIHTMSCEITEETEGHPSEADTSAGTYNWKELTKVTKKPPKSSFHVIMLLFFFFVIWY